MPDVKANEPPNSVFIQFIVGDHLQVAKHSCLRRFDSVASKTQQLQMSSSRYQIQFPFSLLFDLFKEKIDKCYFVTVYYSETTEAGPESLRAGGGLFIIYRAVKNIERVRLGCNVRGSTCVRGLELRFYFLCWVMAVFSWRIFLCYFK